MYINKIKKERDTLLESVQDLQETIQAQEEMIEGMAMEVEEAVRDRDALKGFLESQKKELEQELSDLKEKNKRDVAAVQ